MLTKCLRYSVTLCLCALSSVLQAEAATGEPGQLGMEARAVYAAAYQAMTTGHAYDGTVQLIELLREVPSDDVRQADAFVGPSQLLGFAVASLMDWPERGELLANVLKPNAYPTDELLIAALQAGSGVQSMAFPARKTLERLSQGKHLAVRAAALYILGEPYYYSGAYTQIPAVADLVLNYPTLEFTRCIIETPVLRTVDKALTEGQMSVNLFEDVLYWGGHKETVLQASPGLAKAAEALPSMNLNELTDSTITRWAEGLAANEDPRSRYTIVSLLAKTCRTPERRAAALDGLAAVARPAPSTPDVVRARMVLAEFAREDYASETVESTALEVLKLGVLPCTAERSMYEAMMQTAQHAAAYLTRLGFHRQAITVHEALAAKFPETTLAESELQKAAAIREDGLKASLEIIDKEADAPLRNGQLEKARDLYNSILQHSTHPVLKVEVSQRISRVEQDSARLVEETESQF